MPSERKPPIKPKLDRLTSVLLFYSLLYSPPRTSNHKYTPDTGKFAKVEKDVVESEKGTSIRTSGRSYYRHRVIRRFWNEAIEADVKHFCIVDGDECNRYVVESSLIALALARRHYLYMSAGLR